MPSPCIKCNSIISGVEKCIQCDSCRVWLHLTEQCSGLSGREIQAVSIQKRTVLFFCDECKSAIKRVPYLLLKIENLENEVKKLREEVDTLKNKNFNTDQILDEAYEQSLRANNLMIYNVEESSADSLEDKIEDDRKVVSDVLNTLGVSDKELIRVIRVGKKSSRPRPTKIVLSSSLHVRQALKSSRKLSSSSYRISSDKTKLQQEEYKKVQEELKRRQVNEDNLYIRFRGNRPIIDKKN